MTSRVAIALSAACALAAAPAWAAVDISSAPTKNVACSAGVCSATGKHANLNVADLENLLASSDVTVNTGSGAVTIEITAPLAWASANRLTLDADLNVSIKAQVSVQGAGGLTVVTLHDGSGGEFLFFPGGKIDFWDTGSGLAVNGNDYALLNDIGSLAAAVASNQYGFFALAKDYDAGPDGVYSGSGIPTDFEGIFEGLGHTISNFSVAGNTREIGLFSQVGILGMPTAALRDIRMANANVAAGNNTLAGALAGALHGSVAGASSDGAVSAGSDSSAGGLIGYTTGSITRSFSNASVTAGSSSQSGGLVGWGAAISYSHASGKVVAGRKGEAGGLAGLVVGGDIVQSYATGDVVSKKSGAAAIFGGLVGEITQDTSIVDSYALGAVKNAGESALGGLIGYGEANIVKNAYAIGAVGSGAAPVRHPVGLGGFLGFADYAHDYTGAYWDIDTSRTAVGCGAAKPRRGCPDITGLSDAALKSGLPAGFDPTVWAQSASVNNGYPYLIANPPQ